MFNFNLKLVLIALAISLMFAACGGKGDSKQQEATKSETQTETAKSGSVTKPKVEGIFGEFGLTDADVTPQGATIEPNAGFNEVNKGKVIMAISLFPNWDEAAGKAAWAGYVENLKKAVTKADDTGEIILVEDDDEKWSAYYTYGGKRVYIRTLQQGAQISLNVSW